MNLINLNPFRQTKLNNKEYIINEYRKYIVDYIKNHNLEDELLKLKNKNLGYWTKPEESHGTVCTLIQINIHKKTVEKIL